MKMLSASLVAVALMMGGSAPAHAQSRDFKGAERVYYSLVSKERFEIPLLLIATGDYNGMSTGEFGPRLFRGIQEYQKSIGVPQTGILSGDQFSRLRVAGYSAFSAWGMTEIAHPYTSAKLYIPNKLAPRRDYTKRGLAFEAYDRSMSVDFSFFSASETSLEQLYARLGAAGGARRIDYKVIRPTFFAIAGGQDDRNFYTRYQLSRGGIVGFTTSWGETGMVRPDRVANLMSNLFFVSLEGTSGTDTSLVALPVPTAPAPAPVPPPPPAPAAPPSPSPKAEGGSGTGFFVAPKRMLTNAHVVEGCETVIVAVGQAKGPARVLARDKANDLALVETEATNESTAKLRAGVRLGEDVAAFGYPLNGLLATNGNFTRGGITATAGLRDDSGKLQISAPVQPGNSGGPLLDESGNVVGVVVGKFKALQYALATEGDIPQNINFAIKSSVAQTFLETQETAFDVGAPGETMKPADLAARAQSFSGIIECRP